MIQQTADSLVATPQQAAPARHKTAHHTELTPAQVLKWLPKSATPAQQDSAIQAHIKPAPIHWSTMPDTLHLPGQSAGKSFRDISLPQYYRQSFFEKSKYFHPELPGGRQGVAGEPVPYSIQGDNLITSILLGCFVLAMVAISVSKSFIVRQAKNFFYAERTGVSEITETSNELRFQVFMVLQTCLLLAIIFFFYTRSQMGDTFIIEQYQIIGVFTGIAAAGFALKALAYWVVNWVFFDKRRNEQWMKSFLFLLSTEGVLLFPIVMLLAYFHLSVQSTIIYTAVVIIVFKILTFYKTHLIFFSKRGAFLQNILYFCTLEVVPLLVLWSLMGLVDNVLKISF